MGDLKPAPGRTAAIAVLALLGAFMVLPACPTTAAAGVVGSPHDFSASSEIASGGACFGCHLSHGGDQYVLWSRDLSEYRSALTMNGSASGLNYVKAPTMQCYDCHDYHLGQPEDPGFFPNDYPPLSAFDSARSSHRPQNIAFGFKKNSTGSMTEDPPEGSYSGYYENQPPYAGNYGANPAPNLSDNTTGGHYYKHGDPSSSADIDIGDKLSCRICHDPHAYNSSWQAFMRENWPSASTVESRLNAWSGQASSFMANAPASGLRNDKKSRELCAACHGYAAPSDVGPVKFNEIDGSLNSNAEIVRPPPGYDEHLEADNTACVSCHKHNGIEASCAQCHFYPGKAGGIQETTTHGKHVNLASDAPSGLTYKCKTCHINYVHLESNVTGTVDWAANFDRANVDVNFDPSWNPAGSYDNASRQCSALYCHGDSVTPAGWGGSDTTPVWVNGATAPCGSCHGTGAGMRTGNHPVHLDNAVHPYGPNTLDNASCANGTACHTAYGASPDNTHVDRIRSLRTTGTAPPYDNANLATTQVCVNCHSGAVAGTFEDGSPNTYTGDNLARTYWDNSVQNRKLPCFTCHHNVGAQQAWTLVGGTGRQAANIRAFWDQTGHGAIIIDSPGTTVETAVVDQVPPVGCQYCHDPAAAHFGPGKDTVNPWRLLASSNFANSATGQFDQFCNRQCHSAPPGTDPTPPADHTCNVAADHPLICDPNLDPTKKKKESGDTHWTSWTIEPYDDDTGIKYPLHLTPVATDNMPLHGVMTDNGSAPSATQTFLCVTCHDPHGTGSQAAVPRSFTGVIDRVPGTVKMLRYDYRGGAGGSSELCRKCHEGGR